MWLAASFQSGHILSPFAKFPPRPLFISHDFSVLVSPPFILWALFFLSLSLHVSLSLGPDLLANLGVTFNQNLKAVNTFPRRLQSLQLEKGKHTEICLRTHALRPLHTQTQDTQSILGAWDHFIKSRNVKYWPTELHSLPTLLGTLVQANVIQYHSSAAVRKMMMTEWCCTVKCL